MIPQRYDACYEDITPCDRGDYVKLEDVITMLENAQHIDHESDTDYEIGWDAGLEQLIQKLKKEIK